MKLREETAADIPLIRALITRAFAPMPFSSQTEAAIVDALRDRGKLSVSLIAEDEGNVVGHVAFSPVAIDGADLGWYGLGPIAVAPEWQGQGIGRALMDAGLALGARGCVLLGDPAFYSRFGFQADAKLTLPGVPAEYFQAATFSGDTPSGEVTYDEGFSAS
ncbi:GNAT family N-acetyltransferase [Rhizobium sp. BE258]|jgi:putative acetyltransferase|uniref:GNAT family N-acetyltransferase n=1 Tax=Rhizobium sp. BE258 TaxID=2817722 RepID=UPI000DD95447|nr:N-acetyltransferase [Rhizobium sp. BE258]MDR7142028.1 putative acetyltransferase [Rhizobium sp. BE258]